MAEQCWGVVGIAVDNRREAALQIQELLTEYGEIIMGRMGVPIRDRHICVISLILDGASRLADELIEKLAELPGVHVTSAFTTASPGMAGDGKHPLDELEIDEGRILEPAIKR